MDDLIRYSAADLDPYTLALGQQLCSKFAFSQLGYRNLGTAFDSLPGQHYAADDFEVGYGAYHVLPTLLKTDSGFTLAAVVGLLTEYFEEDIVVGFLRLLADKSGLPHSQRPLEHQWTRLVNVFNGVLSTSTFGLVLNDLGSKLPGVGGMPDVDSLLDSWTTLISTVQDRGRTITLPGGANYVWLAAVAKWIYDLDFTVRAKEGHVVYTSPGISAEREPQLIFSLPYSESETKGHIIATTPLHVTGGRVSFEHFFTSCFGDNIAPLLRDKTLAAYVCSALTIITTTIQKTDPWLHPIFLSREVTTSASGPSRLRDTLLAWFPELARQSKQFSRHDNLTETEAHTLFDESESALISQCGCWTCNETMDERHHHRTCLVALAHFIVTLTIYISPMVVAPRLLPKRYGVQHVFADWGRARRQARKSPTEAQPPQAPVSPSQSLASSVQTLLPTSADMLRVGALLFANAAPSPLARVFPDPDSTRLTTYKEPEPDKDQDAMGTTSNGLVVFLTGDARLSGPTTAASHTDKWHVNVVISPGWMCLFGHETPLELYDPYGCGWSFTNMWRQVRTQGPKLRQIVKWRGRVMLSSMVSRGSDSEKNAEKEGWILLS